MEQRRKSIVEFVHREGAVSFASLKAAFPNVSEMTLRTDLKFLDQVNQIIRVYGGAKSVNYVVGTDDLLSRRSERNKDKKVQIAEKAAAVFQANTTIFLDSGSTVTELARRIPDQDCLVFTTGIDCACELAKRKQPIVHLLGGRLNRTSMCVTGVTPLTELERLHFDVAFLGISCYSQEAGFGCGSEEDCELKRAAIRRSARTVMLMDSAKIGLSSTYTVCGLDEVDTVISDGGVDRLFAEACETSGVQLL